VPISCGRTSFLSAPLGWSVSRLLA
jgi:hypothetical protein